MTCKNWLVASSHVFRSEAQHLLYWLMNFCEKRFAKRIDSEEASRTKNYKKIYTGSLLLYGNRKLLN